MQLNLGILVIGSLFWHDDEVRKSWRANRLKMAEAIDVRVPIRYGRLSKTNTYTIVLSTGARDGQAKVVPCVKSVSSFADLMTEAQQLWSAELKTNSNKTSADWGCVSLIFREDIPIPNEISTAWSDYVKANASQYTIQQPEDESPLLSPSGLLQIKWPEKANGQPLTEVDALLATTTQPTLTSSGKYATTEDIAKAWLQHKDEDHYFYKNREHGIKTFEDEAIFEEFWKASTGAC